MKDKKVLMLGIDALTFNIYKQLRGYGYFKSLNELASRSIIGSINVIPPYTPQAWTSITSGVNPGKHALYGFFCSYEGVSNSERLCTSKDVKVPRIHNIVSFHNLKSLVVNLPFSSYPYVPFKGYLISDWLSPIQYAYPNSLNDVFHNFIEELRKRYEKDHEICHLLLHDLAILHTLRKVGEEVVKEVNYAFIMLSFIDEIMHKNVNALFPPRYDCIKEVLSLFDEVVNEILWPEFLDDETVILVSDHGISKVNFIVSLPRILYENRLISIMFRKNNITKIKLKDDISLRSENLNRNMIKLILKLINDSSILRLIISYGRIMLRKLPYLYKFLENIIGKPVIDLDNSLVIIPRMSYSLYINEALSRSVEESVNKVLHILKESERKLNHNYLEVVIKGKNNIYWGRYADRAPHIVIVPKEGYSFKSGLNVFVQPITKAKLKFGDHIASNLHMISLGKHNEELKPLVKIIKKPWDYALIALLSLNLPIPYNTDSDIYKCAKNIRFADYLIKYNISLKLANLIPV